MLEYRLGYIEISAFADGTTCSIGYTACFNDYTTCFNDYTACFADYIPFKFDRRGAPPGPPWAPALHAGRRQAPPPASGG